MNMSSILGGVEGIKVCLAVGGQGSDVWVCCGTRPAGRTACSHAHAQSPIHTTDRYVRVQILI